MSRTNQYRKVMKPMLERKRRARINKCLDNLKDIMVNTLQSEGESITKLEKADVLELTVRHLQKLKRQNALGLTPQATYAGRLFLSENMSDVKISCDGKIFPCHKLILFNHSDVFETMFNIDMA